VLKSQAEQRERPSCFGDLFDKTAPECVGGFDAKWTGGVGGSRIRPMCDYVDDCSQVTPRRHQQLIPTENLIRSQPHTSFGTSSPSGYVRPPPVPTPMQQRPWGPPSQQQAQPPPQHYQQQHHYGPHFSGNYGIPQYLTVRQPSNSGPIIERMWWEVLRSMGKSVGHTLANFFDSEVFGRHGGPGSHG
jgi:hypothetical protein